MDIFEWGIQKVMNCFKVVRLNFLLKCLLNEPLINIQPLSDTHIVQDTTCHDDCTGLIRGKW